ncbi:hypothetical protein FRC05_005252 [Tulasnella sp. 425]|nr:hypothetical protein FRC05_005252 [Tulasnella sp. 425]
MSGGENAETLQVQFDAQSRKSISKDDLPIRLLSSPVTAQPQSNNFHVWTLVPTFRVMESPVVQPIQRFNPEPPSQIPTIHAPIPPLVLSEPDFSGTFYIKHPSSGFALDLYYSLRVDNTPVTLAEANDGPSQVWKIIKKPRLDSDEPDGEKGKPDHYWVQCVASGTYLSHSELGSEGVPKFATGNAEPLDWL